MTTNSHDQHVASPIHPRLRLRLEQTLASRLASYEKARDEAWSSIANLLHRILDANAQLGRCATRDLEAECWRALHILDNARGPHLPHPADMADLLARVRNIAAMAEALGTSLPEPA